MSLGALIEKFRGVALERVDKMACLVHELEVEYDDELLDALLRETHTLKGEARMMSFADINLVSHLTEQVAIEGLRSTPRRDDTFEVLHFGLDILRTLLTKSAGEAPADLTGFVDKMMSWRNPGSRKTSEFKRVRTGETTSLNAKALKVRGQTAIRVDFERLENLSGLSGEVNLSARQLAHQFEVTHHLLHALNEEVERTTEVLPRALANNLKAAFHRLHVGVQELEYESHQTLHRAAHLEEVVQELRHVPVAEVLSHYPRAVRALALENAKKIRLVHEFGDVKVDRGIITGLSDPLLHLVRNAVDHGVESPRDRRAQGKPEEGEITLICQNLGSSLRVVVRDDGAGMDPNRLREVAVERELLTPKEAAELSDQETLRLIFEPGFSTRTQASDLSGRGIGMDVVMQKVVEFGGSVEIESTLGEGTTIVLEIPTSSTMNSVLLLASADILVAVALQDIEEINAAAGGDGLDITDLFNLPPAPTKYRVTLKSGKVLRAARILGERQALIRPLGAFLAGAKLCRGIALTDTGEQVPLLNTYAISEEASELKIRTERASRVLVVDDSDVTRALIRSILRGAGYLVWEARDGQHAQVVIEEARPHLVVCDLQMPVMDGLEFLRWLRQHSKYSDIAALMLTTQAGEQDKERARDAGADDFMGKLDFDESRLVRSVERLLKRAGS